MVFDVALHLPDVAWVSLGDVDHIECSETVIPLVQFVERRNLPAKRRSSVAAKDEHHGAIAAK